MGNGSTRLWPLSPSTLIQAIPSSHMSVSNRMRKVILEGQGNPVRKAMTVRRSLLPSWREHWIQEGNAVDIHVSRSFLQMVLSNNPVALSKLKTERKGKAFS